MSEGRVAKARSRARQTAKPYIKKVSEMTKPELTWVVAGYTETGMLHAPALNEYETDMLVRRGMYFGGDFLCSLSAEEIDLPGPKTARSGPRCARCCRLLGYPTGIGSPIHDAQIRVMIGLDVPDAPMEWSDLARQVQQIRAVCAQWIVRGQDAKADDYEVGRADMAETIRAILDATPQEQDLAS